MGRGRAGEGLRRYCRALLLAEGRERAADGEPVELAELLAVLEAVRASAVWSELHGVGGSRWELAVTRLEPVEGATPRLVVGTVDAVGMDAAGRPVRLVDWKTDDVQEAEWRARAERYGEQVREYVRILGSFSGRDARATVERVRAAASPVVR
jgi:hypothetical protein